MSSSPHYVENDAHKSGASCVDERALVAAILSGDEAAVTYLFADYCQYVFATLKAAHRKHLYIADDELCSDVYARVSAHDYALLRNFKFQCSLRTWIWGIALNCVYDKLRRQSREMPLHSDEEIYSQDIDNQDVTDNECVDETALIHEALSRMKNLYYVELIVCRALKGYSARETAKLLHHTTASVNQSYARAKNALRKVLLELMTRTEYAERRPKKALH